MATTEGTAARTTIEGRRGNTKPVRPHDIKSDSDKRQDNAVTAAIILARVRGAAAELSELFPVWRNGDEPTALEELKEQLEAAERAAINLVAFIGEDLVGDAFEPSRSSHVAA